MMKKVTEYLKNPPLSKSDLEKKIILCPSYGWIKPTVNDLEDSAKQLIALCDNEAGERFGARVLSFADVLHNYRDTVIIAAVWDKEDREDLIRQIRGHGFPLVTDIYEYIFSKACHGVISKKKELHYLEKAWDFFEDENSREIILNKALHYLGAIRETPFELPQYFIPFMDIAEDEIFADCGFFNGDTAEIFLDVTGGKFKKYYGFEPNTKNITEVKPEIKDDSCFERFEIVQAGVHSYCTTLMFSDDFDDASSFELKGDGNIEVPVVSLDAFFADKEKPTFIKMDIEGSEINAILGAKTLLGTYKPKLAICVYHKPEDIIEIPRLLREIVPEYKFLLKQHSDINADTVLYCKV
ncbi:MAG: FkbM family methyltransferase [Ruminococcus sp.]|jgi:FkbM family methyltransferase|nr:FkbM family methyltransferase [Ruminococcus sp.]